MNFKVFTYIKKNWANLWLLLAGLSDFGVSEVGVWVGLPELSGEGDLKALIGWVPPSLALFLLCSNFLRNEDWRAEIWFG